MTLRLGRHTYLVGVDAGARPHVDGHLATLWHQPVHRLLGGLRPPPVIVLGDRSEGHRTLLTIGHSRQGSPAEDARPPATSANRMPLRMTGGMDVGLALSVR